MVPSNPRRAGSAWLLLIVGMAGCVPAEVVLPEPTTPGEVPTSPTEPTDPTDPGNPADCVPLEAAYTANVQPIVERRCAECHGETPDFGAPFGLLQYGPLVEGPEGERVVDRMVTVLVAGDMPPATASQLTHSELDTLVAWASCGQVHPDPGDSLVVSQPVFAAPDEVPSGAVPIDLTPPTQSISPTTLDEYRSFSFRNVVEADRFVVRIEPVIDESRVVHHITMRQSSTGRYLYTWAPGTDAIQFPDGGLRLVPNDELVVEIHYNNGAGIPDATDASGMRLWVAEPGGTEYGMVDPNSWLIAVAPGSTASVSTSCEAQSAFTVLAGMPHMHATGDTFDQVLIRGDGSEEEMITLTGWSFEAQYFYEMPFDVEVGDTIELTCGFRNPHDHWVLAGLGTGDEMCFDFMYVTPPDARLSCR